MNGFARRTIKKHSGFALVAFLLILVTGAAFVLLRGLNAAATQSYRDAQTASALAEAKAALIGYAVSGLLNPACIDQTDIDCVRPGDLPCPDRNNDGFAESACGPYPPVATDSWTRLGRLPWKTLGLQDLRDGAGERLWYAISVNFKNNTRYNCNPSDPDADSSGCLNSDAQGRITVRTANDTVIYDASNSDPLARNGAIAVLFAPGTVLRRGSGTDQDRTGSDVCTTPFPFMTPRCDPQNYLDATLTEDNGNFYDGNTISSRTNGFIQGEVFDGSGNAIVNDRLLPIAYQDLMPLLEKRVVAEVLTCLRDYAVDPANSGRSPWAVPIGGASPNYDDTTDTRFGRVPEQLDDTESAGMTGSWPTTCNVDAGTNWWLNWKELIFYGVADAYKPTSSAPPSCASSTCLTVNRPPPFAPLTNRQTIVIAAGKRLAGVAVDQPRTDPAVDKGNVSNYLENDNATPLPPTMDDSFTAVNATATFNDVVCTNGSCL